MKKVNVKNMWSPPISTGSIDEKLEKAGISKKEFNLYCQVVASPRSPFIYRPLGGSKDIRWEMTAAQLLDGHIVDHLLGEYYYGILGGPSTVFICIDIDNKNNAKQDFNVRVKTVLAAFDQAAIISSSSSGGVHIYQLLDKPQPLDLVRRLTINRLIRHGLLIKDSNIEIFPSPIQGLRFPFGDNSWVLSSRSLQPISKNKRADIRFLIYRAPRLPLEKIFDQEDFVSDYTHILKPKSNTGVLIQNTSYTPPPSNIVSVDISDNKFVWKDLQRECLEILKSGIQGPGTRNDLQGKLIFWSLCHLYLTEEETLKFVSTWLNEKNNGQSHTYNLDREDAYRLLRGQADHCAAHKRAWGLTRKEIDIILASSLDYKFQFSSFDLLRFLKYHDNKKHWVNIGRDQFMNLREASARSYPIFKKQFEEMGLIKWEKRHYYWASSGIGKRALYSHALDFDHGSEEFSSLEKAIITLMDASEIEKRYSSRKSFCGYLLKLKETNPDVIVMKTFDPDLSGVSKRNQKLGLKNIGNPLPSIITLFPDLDSEIPHKNEVKIAL